MMRAVNQWVTLACSLFALPARVIEESIHTLVAMPFAEVVTVRFDPRGGTAETVVQFREETPRWAVTLAYLAPEALAALAAFALVAWWLVGGTVWWPQSLLDWVLLAVVGAQYLAIALPSAKDHDRTAEVSP